jgi:hypothetical protein
MGITITSARPVVTVRIADVYFAFGSGRLHYDCVSCNAQCCRGHGYTVSGGYELQSQVKLSPSIRLFIDPCASGTSHTHVVNCPPQCFFLDRTGMCSIHTTYGPAAKPSTCRLFPFNHFVLCGSHLMVMPHGSLCPLEIVDDGRSSDQSAHGQLLAELELRGIDAHVPQCRSDYPNIGEIVGTERRVLQLSETLAGCDDYLLMAEAQLKELPPEATSLSTLTRYDRVKRYVERVRAVCGIEGGRCALSQHEVAMMLALTPTIRARLLFRSNVEGEPAFEVPRTDLPLLLLVLVEMLGVAREAGLREVTYQSIMKFVSQYDAFLRMMALLDEVLVWRPDCRIDLSWPSGSDRERRSYWAVARALLLGSQRRSPITFGDVILRHAPEDGLERVLFVKRLGHKLAHKTMLYSNSVDWSCRLRHPRAMLQQATLARVDEKFAADVLASL